MFLDVRVPSVEHLGCLLQCLEADGAGIGVLLKLALQIMFVEALVEFLEDELGVRIHEAAAMLKAGAVVMVG